MYIETMQKIMSKNAKIFVDAKNPPAMYLPFMGQVQAKPMALKDKSSDWQDSNTDNVAMANQLSDNQRAEGVQLMRGMRRDV
jgi:hypothetical protein